MKQDDIIMKLAQVFHAHEKDFYLVGGTVRDELLGRPCHDIDGTTNARPEEIKEIVAETNPKHIIPIGEKFGTIQIVYEDDITVEITTYRSERYRPGSRHPEVQFGDSLHEDLGRRDFTINAIAKNPLTGHYVDPHMGGKDLQNKIIRAVDDPVQRFKEDPLRMLRAIRLAGQLLDFHIGSMTYFAIVEFSYLIQTVSKERIQEELNKILMQFDPRQNLWNLCGSHLMRYVLPEIEALHGVSQHPHHLFDVFGHTMLVVQVVLPHLELRWAALLHDIAKPQTKSVDEQGHAHFYNHEEVGAEVARDILQRLRFGNDFIDHVTKMIRLHMRVNQYTEKWSNASVRRLYADAGDVFDDLLDLAIADGASDRSESRETVQARIDHLWQRTKSIRMETHDHPWQSPLNGDELMAAFGRPAGPWIKEVKTHLWGLVVDDVLVAGDKEGAFEAAREYLRMEEYPDA